MTRRRFRISVEGDRGATASRVISRGAGGATVREVGSYADALSLTVTPTGQYRLEVRSAGTGQLVTVKTGHLA